MYLHPAFAIDADEALPLLEERGFGLFVVPTAGAPFGVHAPFLMDRRGDGQLRIELHVARVNPIHKHVGEGSEALLAVQGPDAYISPDWYGVADQVPTWTYTAVHVKGRARCLPAAANLDHVDRLSAIFEARLAPKRPWTSGKMDARRRAAMLRAIVVIDLEVTAIEAQKKLNQHKGETEAEGAIQGLRGRADPGSAAVAELIAASRKPR